MTRVLLKTSACVQHYQGLGYQYFFRKNWVNGNTAKLQISRKTLTQFEARKGRINSTGMLHLELLSQGSGWYIVASDTPENDAVVLAFLAALNRWVLKHLHPEGAQVLKRERRYTIEAPVQRHAHAPVQPIRFTPFTDNKVPKFRLQELVATVNARFGH